MNNLPKEAINKIMYFSSHPVADMFKQSNVYKLFHEEPKYNLLPNNNKKLWKDHEFIVCCLRNELICAPDHIRKEWHNYCDYCEFILKYSLGITCTNEPMNKSNSNQIKNDSDSESDSESDSD